MPDAARLTLEEADTLVRDVLRAHDFSPGHVDAIAETVTAAERDCCASHGLFRVPGYVDGVVAGVVDPRAEPTVSEGTSAVVRVDARRGYAPLALRAGRAPLAHAAKRHGVAALCVHDSFHFAALWPEVEGLAEDGLVAMAFVMGVSDVAPAGGKRPLYGTNPMAFAWPRPGQPPLVFDQSSSASSRGDIQLRLRDGRPIPEGWAIDRAGQPTTDPAEGLAGAQLPFGGYKGSNIAMMVELLAGCLAGSVFSYEATERADDPKLPTMGGEFMIAIDPALSSVAGDRDRVAAHAEGLFAKVLEQEGARLPSDRRHVARQRTIKEGIQIPRSLHETLLSLRAGPRR